MIEFSRDDTRAIKGFAIILMLMHHLIGFQDRLPVGFSGFDNTIRTFAANLNVCVAIFFFLSGYGLYKKLDNGSFSLLDSIKSFVLKYWSVFVIFVPIGFIFFRNSGEGVAKLAQVYNVTDVHALITKILSNFAMVSFSLNREWWFVRAYIIVLCLGTLYCHFTRRVHNIKIELLIVFCLDVFFRSVLPAMTNIGNLGGNILFVDLTEDVRTCGTFFMGIVLAKYDGLVRLKSIVKSCRPLIGLIGVFVVLWCRCFYTKDLFLDCIYVPVLVVSLSFLFDGIKFLKWSFCFIGKYSMNMWLIHSFYCYYFYEWTKLVYISSNPWVDLVIFVFLTLITAIFLILLNKHIKGFLERMKFVRIEPLNDSCVRLNVNVFEYDKILAYLRNVSVSYSDHGEYAFVYSVFESCVQKDSDNVHVQLTLHELSVFTQMLILNVLS